MKLYKVPLHTQDENSEDCGPVTSTMILDYFGITSDQEEVINKVPRCNFGTSAFDNANTLVDYGLKVEIVMANPLIFDGTFLKKKPSQADIKKRVIEVQSNEKDTDKYGILQSLINYMDNRGLVRAEIPTEEHIVAGLDQEQLVMITMYGKVLGLHDGTYHFALIGGYDEGKLYVYNSIKHSQRHAWHKSEDVMFAIHTNTLFDYDNGALLLVSKP